MGNCLVYIFSRAMEHLGYIKWNPSPELHPQTLGASFPPRISAPVVEKIPLPVIRASWIFLGDVLLDTPAFQTPFWGGIWKTGGRLPVQRFSRNPQTWKQLSDEPVCLFNRTCWRLRTAATPVDQTHGNFMATLPTPIADISMGPILRAY